MRKNVKQWVRPDCRPAEPNPKTESKPVKKNVEKKEKEAANG